MKEIRRSAHQRNTEQHEWFHLVRSHKRPMVDDGIEALDEHVVGRCHVAKSLYFVSHVSILNEREALHGRKIKHIFEITGWHVYQILAVA